MIAIQEEYVEAQVYHDFLNNRSHTHIYLVKVKFTDVGLYINSITVQPSPKHPEKGLWVQLPRYNTKGKWIRPLEVSSSSPLWELIEKLARQAVEEYTVGNDEVYIPTDEQIGDNDKFLSEAMDTFFKEPTA